MTDTFISIEEWETPTTLTYRSKGEIKTFEMEWNFQITISDTWKTISYSDLTSDLDLKHTPVICIGGKKWSHQKSRLEKFKQQAPDFEWVILLLPYSWSNWRSDGKLILPSRAVLEWTKKIEWQQIITEKLLGVFMPDGKYMVDIVKKLWDRVIETIKTQEEPWSALIAERLTRPYVTCEIRLYKEIQTLIDEMNELEKKNVLLSKNKPREMRQIVKSILCDKLQKMNISKFLEIPDTFSLQGNDIN